jgi:methanol--5-hydroxybenzimidazolylcobamide Co-methyltransferase
MNTASGQGPSTARMLQNLMVESDIHTDPQALVLAPDIVIEISREIVSGRDYLEATVKGALKALEIIGAAVKEGSLVVPNKEIVWIDRIQDQLASIPLDEGRFIEDMMPNLDTTKFDAREYGL